MNSPVMFRRALNSDQLLMLDTAADPDVGRVIRNDIIVINVAIILP